MKSSAIAHELGKENQPVNEETRSEKDGFLRFKTIQAAHLAFSAVQVLSHRKVGYCRTAYQ